jgi:hypothetical protein
VDAVWGVIGVGYLWPVLDFRDFVVGFEINVGNFDRDGF